MLAGWLPGRITGPVVVVAGPVVVDATVAVVGVWLVVGARVVVVAPVVGGLLVVVDTMLVLVTSMVVGAAVVGAAVMVGLTVVGGALAVGWVASEGERAVRVVAPSTLAGGWAVAGRAVVAGLLMAPCSGPGGWRGEVRWPVPGRRWWWSMRRLVLARLARWAARRREPGVAVGAGAAGRPRRPGQPGPRWRARRRTAAVSRAAVAWIGAEGVGLAWSIVLVRLVLPAHRVSMKDAHLPGTYDVAPHSRPNGMFTVN
jgi:hypothetical protein